jgi:hypothetical protein
MSPGAIALPIEQSNKGHQDAKCMGERSLLHLGRYLA